MFKTNSSMLSLDIAGLMKLSCYEVQVRYFTVENGTLSETVLQRKSKDSN